MTVSSRGSRTIRTWRFTMADLTRARSAVLLTQWSGAALDAQRRWSTGGSVARFAALGSRVVWLSRLLDLIMSNALLALAVWLRGRLACPERDRNSLRHGQDGPGC